MGTRRVVVGKDQAGKAVALFDGPAGNVVARPAMGVTNTLLWTTDSTPAELSGKEDAGNRQIGVEPPKHGSAFKVLEFAPEKSLSTPAETRKEVMRKLGLGPEGPFRENHRLPGMHRTRSLDYIVILSGEIDLVLDDSEVHLQAGDTVVQIGANHAWVNRGSRPCRLAVVLLDGKD